MPYGEVVELALYHHEHGFYASGGRAGRRGDFLTSPEVGPLFGHVVANAIDTEWDRLGQPDEFTVVDWGAGPGTLLRTVLRAEPRCRAALRCVAVERSASQRALHDETVESLETLLPGQFAGGAGVIVANELLDNFAFTPISIVDGIVVPASVEQSTSGDLVVAYDDLGHATEIDPGLFSPDSYAAIWQPVAADWLNTALGVFGSGRVICIDYMRTSSDAVEIRTFAEHVAAGDPLVNLGTKDITVDVDLSQLQNAVRPADTRCTQAEWLERHGIDELVEDGRRTWESTATQGTLEAMWARSRVRECEALMERPGLGGFTVAEWVI